MTMLTRCAACATTFRLTTEQLASHRGKVRCGRCGTVFSALEHLFEADPASGEGPEDRPPIDTATIDMFDPAAHTQGDQARLSPAEEAPDARRPDGADTTAREAPASTPTEHHPGETPSNPAVSPDPPGDPVTPAYRPEGTGTPLLVGTAPDRRGAGWIPILGAFVAAVALAGQATYHFRDQIAARAPAAKPYMEQACAHIGCRILPPVDGQAISIESSDLQIDNGNRAVLILSAVLRNRADFAQPMPMLELSLTDALDAPVARRVLAPADYARAQPGIAAGGEVQVRVFIDATQVKANGYRLYAFYP